MTMQQLSMMDLLCPPPPTPVWVDTRRPVTIRAYGGETEITICDFDHAPYEIEVRGIRATVSKGCTYVIDGPGSLFWSDSGFRSFSIASDDPAAFAAAVERYIDAPSKDGSGCGGKLKRWWPMYVSQWRGNVAFELRHLDRSKVWDQWGPEKQAEIWARRDAEKDAALARMWAEGIDPNDVGPPSGIKGKWPRFERNEA
ncbi:hypothetical protein ACTJI6_11850 [Paracoccus sp. 22332]